MFPSSELVLKGSAVTGLLEHQVERLKSSVKSLWHRKFFSRVTPDCLLSSRELAWCLRGLGPLQPEEGSELLAMCTKWEEQTSVGFHLTCFDREGIERWRWLSLDTCSFAALTSAPGRKDWGTFLASIMRWESREQYSSGLANCGTIHPWPKCHDVFCGVTAALTWGRACSAARIHFRTSAFSISAFIIL